ncbi:PREDICTED: uncharacterized protein LOC105964529 [Erythranthe guttata]|uniref:uncharacterized protein LOC105964529 n=1 Tax=Erythranthe guttata TaxID=4155 RepID=UPI00064DFBCA|nr:PREDICTED: uncharacterized protein LOC105964529 [Erythranthe guttata]|eukprot:XP_012844489.1 PREDICTED: uncharacterized protein LOC105964529 [Erythranthe guttata]
MEAKKEEELDLLSDESAKPSQNSTGLVTSKISKVPTEETMNENSRGESPSPLEAWSPSLWFYLSSAIASARSSSFRGPPSCHLSSRPSPFRHIFFMSNLKVTTFHVYIEV